MRCTETNDVQSELSTMLGTSITLEGAIVVNRVIGGYEVSVTQRMTCGYDLSQIGYRQDTFVVVFPAAACCPDSLPSGRRG